MALLAGKKNMIIKTNEPLSQHTTFHIGGIAKEYYIPENENELIDILSKKPDLTKYIIGGGSNLLINDEIVFENVLSVSSINNDIEDLGEGRFKIGSSVRLQRAIKEVNDKGYGGIEFLYSVPGLIGGAVVMNAGRGRQHDDTIGRFIESVECVYQGEKLVLDNKDCLFSHRKSIFQEKDYIITSVLFCFEKMSAEESQAKIKDRLEHVKEVQDMSFPTFGTVFSVSDKHIMTLVYKFHLGYHKGCCFSAKRKNWMLNQGEGTFKQAYNLIKFVQRLHRFIHAKCQIEVRMWNE